MLSDAAAADRAAFLMREARPSWIARLVTAAAEVRPGGLRHGGGATRRLKGFRLVRVRGADGLDYLVVRGGGLVLG